MRYVVSFLCNIFLNLNKLIWHFLPFSNLNGKYLLGNTEGKSRYQGIYWNDFHGPDYSLKAVRMMISPVE